MESTSSVSLLRLSSSREISSRSRCSDSASDAVGLGPGLLGHRAGLGLGLGDRPGRLGLGVGLGLVDELLGQQQGPLQGVVGHRRLGRRGGGLLLERRLELGDALGRLAEPLTALAELLLKTLGLDGRLFEVLVDVVPVVALQGLPELDRPQ